jgi:hypothetical protein
MAAAVPTPAQAQFFFGAPIFRPFVHRPHYFVYPHDHDEELTPREIVLAVQDYGFRDATRPVYRADVALLSATDRDGRRLRLTVDVYSGRILSAQPLPGQHRDRLAQRAPDQGAAVRRGVPESRQDARATPDRPPTTVRREPMLPPQPPQAQPPRATPERMRPAQQPAPRPPAARAEPGTRNQPRRIDITPPAALDEVRPVPAPAQPSGPPINSVPPVGLE